MQKAAGWGWCAHATSSELGVLCDISCGYPNPDSIPGPSGRRYVFCRFGTLFDSCGGEFLGTATKQDPGEIGANPTEEVRKNQTRQNDTIGDRHNFALGLNATLLLTPCGCPVKCTHPVLGVRGSAVHTDALLTSRTLTLSRP